MYCTTSTGYLGRKGIVEIGTLGGLFDDDAYEMGIFDLLGNASCWAFLSLGNAQLVRSTYSTTRKDQACNALV